MTDMKLPTRFHIGTQKAGSTFLYNLLASHPDLSLSRQTEVHYYSKYFDRGEEWYLSLFENDGIKIDTSPKYFMSGELVAPRIKATVGEEAKFLLILRNPIDLLNSHFQMHVVSGHFERHSDIYPVVPKSVMECVKLYPNYLKQAFYYTELNEYWYKHFNEKQFKLVIFERFIKNKDVEMVDILHFWGLPQARLTAPVASKNKMLRNRTLFNLRSKIVRHEWLKNLLKKSAFFGHVYDEYLTQDSKAVLTKEERGSLAEILRAEVEQLEACLGGAITEWKDFH